MERLTERFENGQAAVLGCGNNCKYDYKYCNDYLETCPTITEIYEKLAAYEDAEEQGRILPAPLDGVERFSLDGGKTIWQRVYEPDMTEEGTAMNENEAIGVLKDFDKQVTAKADGAYQSTIGKMACDMAIKALEDLQQYQQIGTPEELRVLKDKQVAKMVSLRRHVRKLDGFDEGDCPTCGESVSRECDGDDIFCPSCGQKLDWSDEEWSEELKPCPFCDGKAVVEVVEPHKHIICKMPVYKGGAFIECTECGCAISGETEIEVTEKWNRRANDEETDCRG